MSHVPIDFYANSMAVADCRHPVDILEPLPDETSVLADALARLMVWVAQGCTLRERGYRATVAIHCLRPDALDECTLEEIGVQAGYSRLETRQLMQGFNEIINHGNYNCDLRLTEVLVRLLAWITQGGTLHERGYRATVAVHCLRPDALDERTLDAIGGTAGYSRQAAHQLTRDFHKTFNYEQRKHTNRRRCQ